MNVRPAATDDARIAGVVRALGIGAVRITPLEGGTANTAFRIEGEGRDVVLRLAGAGVAGLGASPMAELAMQELAARAGLAPEVLLAWPDRGVLVTRFAAGDRPGATAMREPAWLARVGRWFAKLHRQTLPPRLDPIDFGERAAGYLATLRAAADSADLGAISAGLERRRDAARPPARLVPCHHDLHHRNLVLSGDRLLALDWEYAGPGDPAADLAAFVGYHDLGAAATRSLLAAYGPGGAELAARVLAHAWVFDCLWYGWEGVAALAGVAHDAKRRAALGVRLAR